MCKTTTNTIIINTDKNSILVIRYEKCNSTIIFDEPNDVGYLYQLAEEAPLTYAKLAMKENDLQDYVDAMNEFN